MKPLDDEKREAIWKEINQAIIDSTTPREGELTKEQIQKATGLSEGRLRKKLQRLKKNQILGVRQIQVDGSRYNVYFPLEETTIEEVLDVLTDF